MPVTSTPTPPDRLALHACCGPCLLEPYDALVRDAGEVAVVYANPNIAPADEYARRRDTLLAYASDAGIEVVELPYDPELWERQVFSRHAEKPERCRACYRLRLGLTARWAAENGFDAIATTLTVSPYQDAEGIREEGERAAADAGIRYLHRDFRERYPVATQRSREQGMYRQNYCGCLPSAAEAEAEREARKTARKAAREAG